MLPKSFPLLLPENLIYVWMTHCAKKSLKTFKGLATLEEGICYGL